jgi:hypothetical protein
MDDAIAIAKRDRPTARWEGFTFNGFDFMQVCCLWPEIPFGTMQRKCRRSTTTPFSR